MSLPAISFSFSALSCLAALFWATAQPGAAPSVVAASFLAVASLSLALRWPRATAPALLRVLLLLLLLGSVVEAFRGWRVAARPDESWREVAAAHLARAAELCRGAMEELEAQARERSVSALAEGAGLEELATPIPFAGSTLDVAVSIWRDGRLVDWAGEVPGPDRPLTHELPLIIDHGFRRTLSVSSTHVDGSVAVVDVELGITRDLFRRLGLGTDPGEPLSQRAELSVELLAEEPAPESVSGFLDRIVGIPPEDSWVWLELRAPAPREERRRAVETATSRLSRWALAALVVVALLGLRRWPSYHESRRGAGIIEAAAIVGILLARWGLERADVLDLAAGDPAGSLALLLEPAYFATTWGFGFLRHVMAFFATALTIGILAVLLLPRWLLFLDGQSPLRRRVSLGVLLAASIAMVPWCAQLQQAVAQNANAKLVGLDAPFFTLPFLVLHLSMLISILAPAGLVLLGWERWLRSSTTSWGWITLSWALCIGTGMLSGHSVASTTWPALLAPLGLLIGPLLRERAFARRVVAALLAVIWLAGLQGSGLGEVYARLKEGVQRYEAEERMNPPENWREFLLSDLLREVQSQRDLITWLCDPTADRANAAFEIWAASSLAPLRYASRIELLARDGTPISRFAFGLPYDPAPLRAWEQALPAGEEPVVVERMRLSTERGPYIVYRGTLRLDTLAPGGDALLLNVELPYAAPDPLERFDLSPNVPIPLGFVAERELEPRREFERPALWGRVGPEIVEAASDERLLGLSREILPVAGEWATLRIAEGAYRVAVFPSESGDGLVVAFVQPTLTERILDASRLIALYVLGGAIALGALVLARALRPRPRTVWPRILGDFGFQERLLGAIVLVVLLPVIISGVAQQRRGNERIRRENLGAVEQRLNTAQDLLASHVDDIAAALIGGEYVQAVLRSGETMAPRNLGPFELSQVMVFATDGSLLLDETLRDFDEHQARHFLESVMPGQLLLESEDDVWYLGRLYPVQREDGARHHVFVRRQITDDDLAAIARAAGAELTLYDGPWAAVSSQDHLLRAGLLSPVLSVDANNALLVAGRPRLVEAEPAGQLVVATGFAVVAGPGEARRGVLSARLFTLATEAAREQERALLFLFGLSSLAFILAVAVGLLLSGRIVGPLRMLAAATERVGRGELDLHVAEAGQDEVGQLVRSFNRMTEELRRGQRSLAARRRFLEAVLGNLSAGVLVLDERLERAEANSSAARLLPGRQEELIERVRKIGPPRELLATEMTFRASDGPRTLRVVVDPVLLEDERPGYLVLFDDVTELLASRRLALYAEMARQVAHEVKNPLTPIQLAAQMVRQACTDDHPRMREIVDENVGQIEAQVERLRGIASEFSLLGRSEPPELEALGAGALLSEVAGLYPSADGSIELNVTVDGEFTVLANREAIVKVLTNLVENSLQAMGGRGRIGLLATRSDGVATLRIEDEGPGIPPEVEDRMFEPYFSTKSTGTGLGLVICRSLMEKMGGSIHLENREDGRGAAAILRLAAGGNDS